MSRFSELNIVNEMAKQLLRSIELIRPFTVTAFSCGRVIGPADILVGRFKDLERAKEEARDFALNAWMAVAIEERDRGVIWKVELGD